MAEKIAFIGLGVMGGPMARHLAERGYPVTVYNRSREKAERWTEKTTGRVADSPAEASRNATFVFTCVGNDDDVRAVVLGENGVLAGLGPGGVLIDHTTTSASLARELDRKVRERHAAFIDAPVSGGQAGAENGRLTVMAGGDEEPFERARPLIEVYARSVRRLGPAGSGQLTKMVNQITIAGLLEGLSEGLHFASAAGLDPSAVIDVISKGAAQSWQMDNRWQTMVNGEFDHGFAVDWMRKDLGICLDEARRNGAHLPVTALVDQLYGEVQSMGGSRWDTSSLIVRLEALRRH